MQQYKNMIRNLFDTYGPRLVTLLSKPGILVSLAVDYYNARILGRPGLFMVDMNVTKRCNFKCEHCFATSFNRSQPEPDTEAIKKMIKACRDAGIVFFNFQGGEPLLREDLQDIIAFCNPRKTSISINTNGYLLNREMITKLRKWGVYGLLLSIDSLSPDDHDCMRNKDGALDTILKNINFIRETGMVPQILTVVTRQSVYTRGFTDLIEYAATKRIGVSFLVAQRVGRWADREDVLCTRKELKILDELNRKYPFMRRDVHNNLNTKGCPAFKYSVYVTTGGEVCPCPFVHVSYGNLLKQSLSEICDLGISHSWFDHFSPICPAAEDRDFIDQIQSKTWNRADLPVPVREIVPPEEMSRKKCDIPKEEVSSCPLCRENGRMFLFKSKEHEYKTTTDDEFSFYECISCGTIYMDPRPSKDSLKIIYPHNYYAYQTPGLEALANRDTKSLLGKILALRRQRRMEPYRQFIGRKGARWLELGSGQGRDLLSVSELYGCQATGIDMGYEEGETLLGGARFIGGDIMAHDFKEEKFDIIYSVHVIEHMASPVEFLKRCYSLLDEEGFCIIETPNTNCITRRLLGTYWGGLHVPRHFVLLNERSIEKLADKTGFHVTKKWYTPNPFFLLWSLHSLFSKKFKMAFLADLFFPSENILKHSLGNYARYVLLSFMAGILSKIEGRGENIVVVLQKRVLENP